MTRPFWLIINLTMNIRRLAETCGKNVPSILTIQKRHGLPSHKTYSKGYAILVKKIIHLSICSISQKDIATQLSRERKLLKLLKIDSHDPSSCWFENLCTMKSGTSTLLLSGHVLGHPSGVQTGLDFTEHNAELFKSAEMGESVTRALRLCMESQESILCRLRAETPALNSALKWARKVSS